MKLTPHQRRQRIYEMMGRNADFLQMKTALDPAKTWFDRFTACLPRRLRNRLREYPGMMFFLHHRIMDAVCENMKFQDED